MDANEDAGWATKMVEGIIGYNLSPVMEFYPTAISDIILIKARSFHDDRGFFMETYQKRHFAAAGISYEFVQDNQSHSRQSVLRGLHYQIIQPQSKLVRVLAGEIFDVAVDLRRRSPTFKQWVGINLSAEAQSQLWVPAGFAHGFLVLSEWADVLYKVTDFWKPEAERTLKWNDATLKIKWPMLSEDQVVISEKDRLGRELANYLDGEAEIDPVYL